MKKKLLMIVNYFYPDIASTGQLMTELCVELQNDFEITVIAAFPNYIGKIPSIYLGKRLLEERYKDIKILRVKVPEFDKTNKKSRIKYVLSYFFNAIYAIKKSGNQDLIFTISQPPILGGILGLIAKKFKRAKLIYNIQDFNPEQIEAVRYSKNKFIVRIAKKFDNYSCKSSDMIVLVGKDMQQTLNKRFNGKRVPNSVIINNWIDERKIYPLSKDNIKVIEFKKKYHLKDKFIFMYSGNIGLFYDLENIIKVIGKFKDNKNVVFAFVGDGAIKQNLIDYCNNSKIENVRFIPYQKKEDLIYSLNAADVHIVTNAKGIKGVSVPSKIYGVMAVGKPILGILEKESEARMAIENSKCGICSSPGDYKKIEDYISFLLKNTSTIEEIGKQGREYLINNFTKNKSTNKYKKVLENL